MHGSRPVEKVRTTYVIHVSESGRRGRVYRSRPSRQEQLRAALAEQTAVLW